MLGDLSALIDDLYQERHNGRTPRKKIVFLIGNGIDAIANILNEKQAQAEAKSRNIPSTPENKEFTEFRWRLFEYARYYSTNTLPTFAHACIFRMIADKICRDVITTNYDMFFDSIWAKHPELKVIQNPIADRDEYLWEEYYSPDKSATGKPRYLKIHGSLSHIVFRNAKDPLSFQLFRLPRFIVPTNYPNLQEAYGVEHMTPSLNYEAVVHTGTTFAAPETLKQQFEPFIDWSYNNDRVLFNREIEFAKKIFANPKKIAAVIMIGFRGYYNFENPSDPWNEELIPSLVALLDKGFNDIYMAVHQKQYKLKDEPSSKFMSNLISKGRCFAYTTAEEFMGSLCTKSKHFPIDYAKQDYALWRHYYFPRKGELIHA
jgi:hypothetical protein